MDPEKNAELLIQNYAVQRRTGYEEGFRAGAEATQAAAAAMLERAQQPAAALGVSLMKLPEPPK